MMDGKQASLLGKAFRAGGIYNLSPADAFKACQLGAILIDVREDYLTDYKRFDVPYFKLCPLSRIDEWQNDLPRENGLIFADATGLRSHEAIQKLMDTGSTTLFNLAGGLVEWERSGLPVKTDIKERLTGSCMCQLKPRERKKS